jgi:hypothetical protein
MVKPSTHYKIPILEGTPWTNEAKDSLEDSPLKINFL